MNGRPLKQEWIDERQTNWFNSSDTSWDNLHQWTARRVGQAINACIDEQTAVSFLKNRVAGRKGKTSYSQACREIEATARNLYRKDAGPSVDNGTDARPRPIPRLESVSRLDTTPEQQAANLASLITTTGISQSDLCALSPCPIPPGVHHHARLFFQTMFKPEDLLFAAHSERVRKEHQASYIRPAAQWAEGSPGVDEWDKIGLVPQFLCLSPLTGQPDDEGSYRSAVCRATVPYMLVEIDEDIKSEADRENSLQRQRDLWASFLHKGKLPIAAIVFSGGKSYHVWIATQANTIEAADSITEELYRKLFDPIGVDSAKKGKATLARVPGAYRREKGAGLIEEAEGLKKVSSLVYLNPHHTRGKG